MRRVMILLIFCLFLCGCSAAQERGEENRLREETDMNYSSSQGAGNGYSNAAEEIERELMTKDEFLRMVSENEDFFGVTVAEFEEIDVEDFIEAIPITESVFDALFLQTRGSLRAFYDSYINFLPIRRLNRLLPQELVIADSTDEEYESFKESFFAAIGHEILPWSHRDRAGIVDGISEGFEFENADGRTIRFILGRTMYIEQLREMRWQFSENPVWVLVPVNDMEEGARMFLSSCGRFFLLDGTEDIVRLFIELDISDIN